MGSRVQGYILDLRGVVDTALVHRPSRKPSRPTKMSKQTRSPSICIVSHNAYGALTGGRGHIGGVERQTALTAKWLAARGYAVSIVTWDEGQDFDSVVDDVRCIRLCKATEGVAVLRFLHPRMTSLFKALTRADADVYYFNCAEYYAGAIAWWCKRNARGFVYSAASDQDCEFALPAPSLRKSHHKAMFRYGMRNSNTRIVQTRHQQNLLESEFGLQSVVLPMPCVDPSEAEVRKPEFPEAPRIVWVGRLDPQKRLEWLFDLAHAMPSMRFEIAAAGSLTDDYGAELFKRGQQLPNVKWLGSVSRELMPSVYRGALCLCCTSDSEGFPNTFLEAWGLSVPVVTSFDPDNIVELENLGRVGKSVEALKVGIRDLAFTPRAWAACATNARRVFVERHSLNTAMARFERLFVAVGSMTRAR